MDTKVKQRELWKIYIAVNRAVKSGIIKREGCEICGLKNTVAHHDDYSKPLTVRWLCGRHHSDWHKRNKAKKIKIKEEIEMIKTVPISYRDEKKVLMDLKKDADKNFHGSVVDVIRFAVRKHLYLKTKKK